MSITVQRGEKKKTPTNKTEDVFDLSDRRNILDNFMKMFVLLFPLDLELFQFFDENSEFVVYVILLCSTHAYIFALKFETSIVMLVKIFFR